MKIDQLKYLIEVVKAGSINAASKKLFISQQSLNQSLRSLEYELGFDVLVRTKKGATLTPRGKEVYTAALAIIARYDQMLEKVKLVSAHAGKYLSGQLTIHTSPMISVCLMPIVYVDYLHAYPNVQVYCLEKYQNNIIEQVSKSEGDVGYILVSNTHTDFLDNIPDNVELELLQTYPIFLAMSPRHPLAHHHTLSLQAIKDYPLIVFEVGGPAGQHALQNEVDLKVILSTNNYNMCRELLNEGDTMIYSYRPYMTRGIFLDCVHIPLNAKGIEFRLYRAYNKNCSKRQKDLIDSFNVLMEQYM